MFNDKKKLCSAVVDETVYTITKHYQRNSKNSSTKQFNAFVHFKITFFCKFERCNWNGTKHKEKGKLIKILRKTFSHRLKLKQKVTKISLENVLVLKV